MGTVGSAAVFQLRIGIDDLNQIAKKLVGLVVWLGQADCWTADDDGAFESGEEGELAVLRRAEESPEIGERGMLGKDIEVVLKRLGAVRLRECGKAGFLHGFVLITTIYT